MGLILDSSILIAGERGGESVRAILKRVQKTQGETESGLSAVTVSAGEPLPKNFAVT